MAAKHRCPPRCHLCPDLDGDLMPMCMGSAALAIGPRDRSYCTCRVEEVGRRRDIDQIAGTVRALFTRVRELEKQLGEKRGATDETSFV
jgi:hypothetical protein